MLEAESSFSKELSPCVAENRVRSRSLLTIYRSSNKSLAARRGPGIRSGAPHSLGILHGARTEHLAFLTQCDESTVRRTCRRYERLGLSGVLDSPTRSGRPIVISPPATCPDRRTRLLGARGQGPTHYPLDQRRFGPTGCRRRYCASRQRADCPPDLARRRLATSSDSLLEDGSPGCSVQAAG